MRDLSKNAHYLLFFELKMFLILNRSEFHEILIYTIIRGRVSHSLFGMGGGRSPLPLRGGTQWGDSVR